MSCYRFFSHCPEGGGLELWLGSELNANRDYSVTELEEHPKGWGGAGGAQ